MCLPSEVVITPGYKSTRPNLNTGTGFQYAAHLALQPPLWTGKDWRHLEKVNCDNPDVIFALYPRVIGS